jgi:hypothetical protein
MNNEILTDEEVLESIAPREAVLTRATAPGSRRLGELMLRPLTSETLTYLWHTKNFFLGGGAGDAVASANPMWSTAEFIYIHAADIDEVATVIWDSALLKQKVSEFLRGPLSDPQLMTQGLEVITEMLNEHKAAQNQSAAASKHAPIVPSPGKKPARAGKRLT